MNKQNNEETHTRKPYLIEKGQRHRDHRSVWMICRPMAIFTVNRYDYIPIMARVNVCVCVCVCVSVCFCVCACVYTKLHMHTLVHTHVRTHHCSQGDPRSVSLRPFGGEMSGMFLLDLNILHLDIMLEIPACDQSQLYTTLESVKASCKHRKSGLRLQTLVWYSFL